MDEGSIEETNLAHNALVEQLKNLSILTPPIQLKGPSQLPLVLPIATNEFYYGLGLNNFEKLAEEQKTTHQVVASGAERKLLKREIKDQEKKEKAVVKAARKEKKERKKKEKADQKAMERKMERTQENLKKLTFTVKNDRMKVPTAAESFQQTAVNQENPFQKPPSTETYALLERLRQLQAGTISSEQLQKMHPLPPLIVPSLKRSNLNKGDELQRNREEVQRINKKIQEKIANQIKPKLRKILDRPDHLTNGFQDYSRKKTYSESSQSQREQPIFVKRKSVQEQTRPVPIVKTIVKPPAQEEVEIYRYSKDDLYQLQSSGTLEKIPRLLQLKLYVQQHSEFDLFLLNLLTIKDEKERQVAILEAAEKRRLINRTGPTDFEFSSITARERDKEMKVEMPSRKTPERIFSEIERLKSIAKNDDELNELVYQYEFTRLFKDVLTDSIVKTQSLPEMIKHLVDSNQAYIIEGEVRVNGRKNCEAYVTQGNGKKDVCVNKLILRKQAFEGDFVKVLVKQQCGGEEVTVSKEEVADADPSSDDEDVTLELDLKDNDIERHYGCVLEILQKRHSRRVIGSLSAKACSRNRKHVTFTVRDSKIPNVRVGRDSLPKNVELTENMLMVVQITDWSYDTPKGQVVEIIGVKGELKAENAAILLQHNLNPEPYSQDIINQLPSEPFTIPAEEFSYRQDLRKKCIFSIDPETARDLDDALSCEVLPNGNLEIGVHISDVTYFLKENSELDDIVKQKATSVYLVDTVYHMLPVNLCLLCSLLPGADKVAYSVFWEMNAETAEIINTRFTRSVVNSCAKLSYEHAQAVLEKENQNWNELENFPEIYNGFTVNEVADVIVKLQKIAVILRAKRKENGSLKIDQPKIAFKFDKDDQRMEAPVDFYQYCIKDSNRLIEDFMLLANISVAKFIYEKFPEISLLRHHAPPKETALKKLVHTLQKSGIVIDVSSASSLSESMERLIGGSNATSGMNAVLNLMVSKTMTRAAYFCSSFADGESAFKHYALSMPIYTHFTSPIRRYADVMVHRVLNAALGYEDPPSRSPDEVQELANISNGQKYSAKLAGDDSSNLYFMQFIRSLKTKTMMAGVVGIFDYNLEVVLVETGHVLKVYYKNLQHNDDVIVTPFTDEDRPRVVMRWPKLKMAKLDITFGSQILVEISVSKDKLTANRVFYQQ